MTGLPSLTPQVDTDLPRAHTLDCGQTVWLARLGRDDRDDLVEGFAGLSRTSRYLRFFSAMPSLPQAMLDALVATDGDRHVAVCARRINADGVVLPPIVGVARYFRDATDSTVAEPAVAVIDDLHRAGLGRLLLKCLVREARAHGIERYRAHALATNERIQRMLLASKGVVVERDGPVVVYEVDIRPGRKRGRRRLRDILAALLPGPHA